MRYTDKVDPWEELMRLMAKPETAERVVRLLKWKLPRLSADDLTDALYEAVAMLAELKKLDPGLPAAAAEATAQPRLFADHLPRLQCASEEWAALARQNRWPRSPLLNSGNLRLRNWLDPEADPFVRLLRLTYWFAHDYRNPAAKAQTWEDQDLPESASPSPAENLDRLALVQSVQATQDPEAEILVALLETLFEETAQAQHPTKAVEWKTVYQAVGVSESEGRRLRRKLAALLVDSTT